MAETQEKPALLKPKFLQSLLGWCCGGQKLSHVNGDERSVMRASVKQKAAPGLEMVEREMPPIGENDVLIKVLRTGCA